jgi:hypothetical protein
VRGRERLAAAEEEGKEEKFWGERGKELAGGEKGPASTALLGREIT